MFDSKQGVLERLKVLGSQFGLISNATLVAVLKGAWLRFEVIDAFLRILCKGRNYGVLSSQVLKLFIDRQQLSEIAKNHVSSSSGMFSEVNCYLCLFGFIDDLDVFRADITISISCFAPPTNKINTGC